jgi:Cu/Zn superoxide dismutase
MGHFEDIHFEDIAPVGPLHKNRPGERVNTIAIDVKEFREAHSGAHLRPAGVDAFHVHDIAGCDAQARFNGAVPAGVSGQSRENMVGHGYTSTII